MPALARQTTQGNTGYRPQRGQCHGAVRRTDGSPREVPAAINEEGGEEIQGAMPKTARRVLVAPVMGQKAFAFIKKHLGTPDQKVPGCDRQGVIIHANQIRGYMGDGGGLVPHCRPANATFGKNETIIPLVAIYQIQPDGSSDEGRTYQLVDYLLEA